MVRPNGSIMLCSLAALLARPAAPCSKDRGAIGKCRPRSRYSAPALPLRLVGEPVTEDLLLDVAGGSQRRCRRRVDLLAAPEVYQREVDTTLCLSLDVVIQPSSQARTRFEQILDLSPGVHDRFLTAAARFFRWRVLKFKEMADDPPNLALQLPPR